MPVMQQPPGWYPNPVDATQLRWWDGSAWTDHTVPLPSWQQPPGWQVAPSQPKRRIWPWIVFPVLAVLLIVGVAAAIFVPRVIGEFKHPIDAANVFFGDIRDGRFNDAYHHECTRIQQTQGLDQFFIDLEAKQNQVGHLTKFNAHLVHPVTGHGNEALVDVDLTYTHGGEAVQVLMVNENGHWLYCGQQFLTN